ncbi:TonB C-terminal domain-containing protein [Oxalobacteraceae sp. CFBP 13730]|nr:TonB C-terminal domain-containing protein [Oxalobacteraceae sp. CFBP 13730]
MQPAPVARVQPAPTLQNDDAAGARIIALDDEKRDTAIAEERVRQQVVQRETARAAAAAAEQQRLAELTAQAQAQAQAREQAASEALASAEAAQRDAERADAQRLEEANRTAAVQREAARAEITRQEQAKRDVARQEQARLEAARAEATRLEQARLAQQEASRQDAIRQEAARQEASRQDAIRQEAARQAQLPQVAPAPVQTPQEAQREERLRAIGRQLNQEAAQRDAAGGQRRGWLLGRADANADLVAYAEAMGRKIELNMSLDAVRDVVKQPHRQPLVTVAVRSDGSVERVTFVTSSGVPAVDEAIRQIIASHAPYGPFPPALARQYDVVEIRRTWLFDVAVRLQ